MQPCVKTALTLYIRYMLYQLIEFYSRLKTLKQKKKKKEIWEAIWNWAWKLWAWLQPRATQTQRADTSKSNLHYCVEESMCCRCYYPHYCAPWWNTKRTSWCLRALFSVWGNRQRQCIRCGKPGVLKIAICNFNLKIISKGLSSTIVI